MHGCRSSIGSGANIRVMDDPWLRRSDGVWIPSPQLQVQGVHNLKVCDLMVPNMKVWERDKIESYFSYECAKCILAIPLWNMTS
jgi:hypothetical protein